MNPTIGSNVHYVADGTPGDDHQHGCRAALVTALQGAADDPKAVSLTVFVLGDVLFKERVRYEPYRAGNLAGGTWHWPEHVD